MSFYDPDGYPDLTAVYDEGRADRLAGKPMCGLRDLWDERDRHAYERGWWSLNDEVDQS